MLASAILQVGLAVLNVGKAIGSTLFSTTTLSVGQTIATAAITGFISGTLGAVIAGANIGDALKSGLVSAGIAAALAALATHGAKVKARRKGSGMADKSSIALRQRLEEVVPNAELQGISAQDLAHNTQEKWGAKRLTLGELKSRVANTWDNKTNERILSLSKDLQSRATSFINRVHNEHNIKLRISHGYRSIQKQNALYAQGRTTSGKIVTNAKGGQSLHNYGKAFDVVIMEDIYTPIWTPISEDIARIGIELGLEWGGNWKSFYDPAHFQIK